MLKLSLDVIAESFTVLLNMSWKICKVASEWKKARVTLFKSFENCIVNTYRPASVLHIVSKIIKRHVFNSFYEYLNMNLLTEYQSGFRPKHSCETALHNTIDECLNIIDDGKLTS